MGVRGGKWLAREWDWVGSRWSGNGVWNGGSGGEWEVGWGFFRSLPLSSLSPPPPVPLTPLSSSLTPPPLFPHSFPPLSPLSLPRFLHFLYFSSLHFSRFPHSSTPDSSSFHTLLLPSVIPTLLSLPPRSKERHKEVSYHFPYSRTFFVDS